MMAFRPRFRSLSKMTTFVPVMIFFVVCYIDNTLNGIHTGYIDQGSSLTSAGIMLKDGYDQ